LVGPAIRFPHARADEARDRATGPEHNAAILRELGYSNAEIAAFHAGNVI
jgi:crotonobetainyl-CoA:carnitine CoA-transferase CaiB-like acyl-CoA transferase